MHGAGYSNIVIISCTSDIIRNVSSVGTCRGCGDSTDKPLVGSAVHFGPTIGGKGGAVFKTAGPGGPAGILGPALAAELQLLDDGLVAGLVPRLQIVEQSPALRDHLEKAAARVIVFLVGL